MQHILLFIIEVGTTGNICKLSVKITEKGKEILKPFEEWLNEIGRDDIFLP